MRRRDFVGLLGGAATWATGARAQQGRTLPLVGLVSIGATGSDPGLFGPFLDQMEQLGYIDGQSVVYDRRFAAGRDEMVGAFVADLVRRPVDIIVVTGTRESIAARDATTSIPIVTIVNPDPIGLGLAHSLARPGGNVTGLTDMDFGIYGKRIEILKQAMPDLRKAGLLTSTGKLSHRRDSAWARGVTADARSLAVELDIVEADGDGLDAALAEMAANAVGGVIVTADGVFVAHRKALVEGTIRHRLPAIFPFRAHAEAGGLLVYAARYVDLSRRAAFFVDRIIKGAKPADLPIEQPTKFELIINLRTAKALRLDVPAMLLAQADEVIE